jgi:hypothetical protein
MEENVMERKMPPYGMLVLVKVLIPMDYNAPAEFYDCHGLEFICTGTRYEPDDGTNLDTWDIWVNPVFEDLKDEDILAWEYLPDDITQNKC